jgi:hypothetical protein
MTRTGLKANKTPGRKRECESKSGRGEQEGERTYCLRMLPWTTRIDFQIPAKMRVNPCFQSSTACMSFKSYNSMNTWYHLDKQKTASLIVLQRRGFS